MSMYEPYAARVQENEAHRQHSLGHSIGILLQKRLHVENSKKTLDEAHDWLLSKVFDSENGCLECPLFPKLPRFQCFLSTPHATLDSHRHDEICM